MGIHLISVILFSPFFNFVMFVFLAFKPTAIFSRGTGLSIFFFRIKQTIRGLEGKTLHYISYFKTKIEALVS